MDSKSELRLFGSFELRRGGAPVGGFESDQVRALLAYLAVEPARSHRRESLAALLWPDEAADVALHRLRQALANLRLVLGDRAGGQPVLNVTRADVQINPSGGLWCDAAAFADLLRACRAHPHRRLSACRPCAARLAEAAALVGGPFLAGLSLARSAAFTEWSGAHGERLHGWARGVFETLAGQHERRGELESALLAARRALALEAWSEPAHRTVMRCLAAGGDRAGALRQFMVCRTLLRAELGVEPEPATQALRDAIEAGAFPRPRQGPSAGAPLRRTRFVGRRGELAELLELAAHERLITLVGPGGCGKTRLALQLFAELAPDLPTRAWTVELDRLADPEQVGAAIAAAIGMGGGAPDDALDAVVGRVAGHAALLLVDNCEHVRGAAARVIARLTRECPHLLVVATSREPLRVGGEIVWPVPPLALPHPASRDVDDIAAAEAVALFVARVRRLSPAFALHAGNASAIGAICRRLDGMPLAIELAASWARLLAPEELLRRLDDRLALASVQEDVSPRHRSLRDVLAWSEELLEARERVLFRRLAVFRGGWTLDAAEAICADADTLPRPAVLESLAALFDKSLVVATDTPDGLRYSWLEPVRQYAIERLATSGDADALRRRHADYFRSVAEEAAPRLRHAEQLVWHARLETERPNLAAALEWWIEQEEAEPALRVVGALGWFWHTRGYWREGYALAARVVALAGGDTPARAQALCAAGTIGVDIGQLDQARGWARAGLALSRAAEDRAGECDALNVLGLVAAATAGDEELARSCFHAALALAEALRDRWASGRAAWNLGNVVGRQGDLAAARRLYDRALVDLEAAGAGLGVTAVTADLARVTLAEGNHAEARRLFESSLAGHQASGLRYGLVACLRGLAALDVEEGAVPDALARLEQAHQLAREIDPAAEAEIARELAALGRSLVSAEGDLHDRLTAELVRP